jgi:hypothetical protein
MDLFLKLFMELALWVSFSNLVDGVSGRVRHPDARSVEKNACWISPDGIGVADAAVTSEPVHRIAGGVGHPYTLSGKGKAEGITANTGLARKRTITGL